MLSLFGNRQFLEVSPWTHNRILRHLLSSSTDFDTRQRWCSNLPPKTIYREIRYNQRAIVRWWILRYSTIECLAFIYASVLHCLDILFFLMKTKREDIVDGRKKNETREKHCYLIQFWLSTAIVPYNTSFFIEDWH